MAGCDELENIEEALKKYESEFWAQEDAQEIFDANAKKWAKYIDESIAYWNDSWNKGNYFDAGSMAGHIKKFLGTAP